jgi:hypothetical protein
MIVLDSKHQPEIGIATNVLQLGEVADLEAQMFSLALMFIRNPNVQFSTEPAILPNCCYLPFLIFSTFLFILCLTILRKINFLNAPSFCWCFL